MFVSVESTLVSPGGTRGYSGKGEPGGAGYLGDLPVPMHLAKVGVNENGLSRKHLVEGLRAALGSTLHGC